MGFEMDLVGFGQAFLPEMLFSLAGYWPTDILHLSGSASLGSFEVAVIGELASFQPTTN